MLLRETESSQSYLYRERMVLLAVSDRQLIETCLAEVGVCWRCSLRFTGEKYAKYYQSSELSEERKKKRPNSCVACLGLLQDHVMEPLLSSVVESITNSGYDADSFSVTLSVPMCLSLRQHSLMVHLRQQLPASCVMGLEDHQVVAIKQVWKYVFPDIVASHISMEFIVASDEADFQAEVQAQWAGEGEELACMAALCPQEYAARAKNIHVYNMGVYSRTGVDRSLAKVDDELFRQHYPVPPPVPDLAVTVSTKLLRSSCFIGGRYCKYSRDLPQTPWFINNVRKCESSVEELVCLSVNHEVEAVEYKFLASGREDVDVRMLGGGRPFALECCNPKKAKFTVDQLRQLEVEFNKKDLDITVHDLRLVSKEDIKTLKEGEEEKTKEYTALCVTATPVDPEKLREIERLEDLQLEQQTPIRVLHRRANATRQKVVHSMRVSTEGLTNNMFKLHLVTSAGTYVKEFVHSDFSRTRPSIQSLLGVDTDILALDVLEVKLAWPPAT